MHAYTLAVYCVCYLRSANAETARAREQLAVAEADKTAAQAELRVQLERANAYVACNPTLTAVHARRIFNLSNPTLNVYDYSAARARMVRLLASRSSWRLLRRPSPV